MKAFLILLSCVSIFAQRTPLRVNNQVVNNPNLTNSASVTWSVNGANVSAAATGGDTIWTNDNGTISSPVTENPSVWTTKSDALDSQVTMTHPDAPFNFLFQQIEPSLQWALYEVLYDDGTNVSDVSIFAHPTRGPTVLGYKEGYEYLFALYPDEDDGVPYLFGTRRTFSSGNLFEINNNTTNKFEVVYDGSILSDGYVELQQIADGGTPSANSARLFAKDAGGTAELYTRDEAGNETLQTPHPDDAPALMEDRSDGFQDEFSKNLNHYVGQVEWINQTRMAKFVQRLMNNTNFLASLGETNLAALAPARRRIYHVESFAQYNTRTGGNLVRLDWDAVQAEKQAQYDAARAAELERFNQPLVRRVRGTNVVVNDKSTNVIVRPIRDVRKPKPAWMQ